MAVVDIPYDIYVIIDILFLAIFQLFIRADNSPYSGFTIIFKYSNSQRINQKYSVYMTCTDLNSSCLKTGSPNIANLVKSNERNNKQ